jgi:hypothetical protein
MPHDPQETRRLENVRVLLRTLNDIYPGPSTLKQTPQAGVAPGRRVPCRLCNPSSGKPRPKLSSCPGCDGDGWRKRRKGDPAWDEYTGLPVATDAEPKKAEPMSPARLEAELARVQHDLILREGRVDPDEAYSWEKDRERRDRDASYRELERALDVMQIEWPLGRSAVTWSYFGIGTLSRELDELVVGWIAARMPRKIRVPSHIYKQQQEEVRGEIRRMAKSGATLEQIAAEMGVGLSRVRTVLAGTMRVSAADESAALVDVAGGTP